MIRLSQTHIIITLLIIFALLLLTTLPAKAVTLKKETIIEGDYLKLEHVFDDLTSNHDYVLAPAPSPGNKTILNAYSLNTIAKAFGLAWNAPNPFTQAVIKRSATIVGPDKIADAITQNIKQELVGAQFRIELANRNISMVMPASFRPTVSVKAITYDHLRQSFSADVQGSDGSILTVSGYAVRTMTIPVLNQNIRSGEIITASHITYIKVDENEITQNTIIQPEQLIGLTPKRFVREMSMVQINDVTKPLMVKKGEIVSIIYTDQSISITAKGKSLQSGAKGDIIRVVNPTSSRVFEAIVEDFQSVSVNPAMKATL